MGISSSINKGNISYIISKKAQLKNFLKKAESAYIKGEIINKSIPSDFKILFILFRNITVSGIIYTIEKGSVKEKIFYEAVNNFKYSVENFSNKNVYIIPKIKEINENINSTFPTYLQYGDIISIIN